MKKLIALLLSLAMVLALAACGGNNGSNSNNQTGDEGGNLNRVVQLNYVELVFNQAGDSAKLEVQGLEGDYTAAYTTSDEAVATVAEDGTVTAVAPGTATISAKVEAGENTYDFTCAVKCDWSDVEVTASHTEMNFTAFGESQRLQPVGLEGTYIVTYTSADENVAVVDLNGNITAAGPGSTTVTMHIEADGEQYDFTCAVTCTWESKAPTLNRTDFTLKNVGDTFRLQASNIAEGAEITWTSSDEKVATVSSDGTVTAVGGGNATITATVDEGGDTFALLCVVRCSAKAEETGDQGDGSENGGESTGTPTLSDFYATLSETYGVKGLAAYEGEVLENYYPGMTAVSTKQCLVQETMMTMANAAVAMVEVSDSGDVQTVKDIFAARAKVQADGGAWYPASCETWKNAVIVSTGNYVGMFVYPENAQAMADLFVSTFGK